MNHTRNTEKMLIYRLPVRWVDWVVFTKDGAAIGVSMFQCFNVSGFQGLEGLKSFWFQFSDCGIRSNIFGLGIWDFVLASWDLMVSALYGLMIPCTLHITS